MGPPPSLQDTLQAEFSPPLDTSLIAAIVADYVTESSFETSSDEQLQTLRATLQMLAAQAEQDEEYALSDKFSNLHISPQSTADDCSTDYMFTESTTSTSDTSEASSFISALAFLQAIFPQLSADKLLKTLNKVGDIEDVDMENVVEELLTGEYVRELEELGVDGVDAEVQDDDEPWKTAEGKPRVKSKQGKKANKRGITIPIVDIRQRNHAHAQPGPSRLPPPDPWAQLSSVASYLQTLIPSHQSTFFLSHFHSPDYANPGDALRAALFSISRASTSTEESEYALLSSVLDLLQEDEMYKTRNAEQRDRLERDAILALRATQAQPDLASDILRLLLELDTDNLAWRVYHAPVPVQTKNNYSPRPVKLPKGPPSIPQPPLRWKSTIPSNDVNSWMTVPISRRTNVPDTLANSIPAYNASNTIRRARANGKMGELLASKKMEQLGDRSEGHRRRMVELMAQQRDAMREASRAWQKGNSKSRGGEVALFYADRAREIQEQAKKEGLDAATTMVLSKRQIFEDGDVIDLHGTTVAEAIAIVKGILAEGSISGAKPLRIITGRGKHSIGGVGVLQPAVKTALLEEGWIVRTQEAGLLVKGRKTQKL